MYKINNITFDFFGIIAGKVSGEDLAVKGIFDLPERIGDTHREWADSDSVEPYVDADELFYGGRTILFNGIMIGSKIAVEANLAILRTAITSSIEPLRFETPYGTACVIVKKITPKLYNGGAIIDIEMREPVVGATCNIVFENTIYYSAAYSESTLKNDCASGYDGSSVQLTAAYGKFTSTYNQLAADTMAINWVKEQKQDYANNIGVCTIKPTVYYNAKLTQSLAKNDCGAGYFGSVISYEVAAYKYSSLLSQIDADAKAQAEMDAILTQAYANEKGTCTLTPTFICTWNNVSNNVFRAQQFTIGGAMVVGTTYYVMVYSHEVSYTSILGDTPQSIVQALVTAINNTTEAEWNDHNSAPLSGTVGFPPFAIAYAGIPNVLSVSLNKQNQFASGVR